MMRQYIFSLTRSPHAAVLLRAAKKLRLREDFAKAPVMGLKKSKKKMKSCAHAHTHTHTHTHSCVDVVVVVVVVVDVCVFGSDGGIQKLPPSKPRGEFGSFVSFY